MVSSVRNCLLLASLVFSSWTTTLDALGQTLNGSNMQYARIDGSLTLDQRRNAIQSFQAEPGIKVMLLTFGSGSVG
jgi:SNF2 family DNA or RNA helicase